MPENPDFLTPKGNSGQAEDTVVRWRTVNNRAFGIWSGGALLLPAGALLTVFPQLRALLAGFIAWDHQDGSTVGEILETITIQ